MLKVEETCHGMKGICIENPSAKIRRIIRNSVLDNFVDSIAHKLSREAGAFLQSDSENFLMIEFWKENYQPFVDYLNEKISNP